MSTTVSFLDHLFSGSSIQAGPKKARLSNIILDYMRVRLPYFGPHCMPLKLIQSYLQMHARESDLFRNVIYHAETCMFELDKNTPRTWPKHFESLSNRSRIFNI